MNLKTMRLVALLTIGLPALFFGTASATFLYRIHQQNSLHNVIPLKTTPAPSAQKRLLIFTPHPDDETLGCAGIIHQAITRGASVDVCIITNGDGFRMGVERQYRKVRVGSEDFIRFASLRQKEADIALGFCGLSSDHISFMGYPDQGLMPLWQKYWSPGDLYTSNSTGFDHSPYPVCSHPGAQYCGQSLLDDIRTAILKYRPTDVYVTHPSDDHPDHSAASAFVYLALSQISKEQEGWANECKLHYYLVHRGDWPVPQGMDRNAEMTPPGEMTSLDTNWKELPLSDSDVEVKTHAIGAYASQTAMMKRFLFSFVRRNEIYGDLPVAEVPRRGPEMVPLLLDPTNDTLIRDFQGGADISAIYAMCKGENLIVKVNTTRQLAPNVQMDIQFRYFGDRHNEGVGGQFDLSIKGNGAGNGGGIASKLQKDGVQLIIPLRMLNYSHLASIAVTTRASGISVDKTGYRFFRIAPFTLQARKGVDN